MAVGVEGELVHAGGYGMVELEHAVSRAPDTVLHVASVSKSVVARQVAQLAAEGRLDLDADVRGVLPEVPDLGSSITARHLPWHTRAPGPVGPAHARRLARGRRHHDRRGPAAGTSGSTGHVDPFAEQSSASAQAVAAAQSFWDPQLEEVKGVGVRPPRGMS